MSADDCYGHTTLCVQGTEIPVATYYYVENDGWSYMNRGPERRLHFRADPRVLVGDVLLALDTSKLSAKTRRAIEEALVRGDRSVTVFDESES